MTEAVLAERLSRLSPEQRARLRRMVRASVTDRGAIPRTDRSTGRQPMSSAQRRLYFLQNLEPDSAAYHVVEAIRLTGRLEVPAVRAALATVVARHEILRTRCVSDTELVIVDDAEPDLGYLDLSDEGVPAPLVNVRKLFARLAERPFRLDSEAPLRVTLVQLAEDDHALLFVAHHIASDAWSSRQLVREFFAAYAGAALDPLPVQYGDFAAWQRDQLTDVAAHLDYWRERLAGMPPMLELPLDRPRPATRSDRGAELHLDLDPALCQRVRAVARQESVTPFVLLLTAFGHVLHRHCATEDVVVGTPVAGRNHPDVENLLGCFVNTLVLRLDLGAAGTVRELVRRVSESTLDAYEHQDLPFERLVAELNPDRDLSANQLVQVMFNYHTATALAGDLPGLAVRAMGIGVARARFDLSCAVVETEGALRATLTYATGLFSRPLITRIGAHFVETLESLVAGLDAPVTALPAVPTADRELVRPKPGSAPRHAKPFLVRFEEQAAADPLFPAVRCRDAVLDYGELNVRANRLARHLRAAGTRSGDLVALLFERSVDYVVAMLAVQKAGATYVPLDPDTPASHITSVLTASSATVLLTHNEVDRVEVTALAPPSVDIVVLEDIAGALAKQSTVDIGRRPVGDEAMYVVFTSGSTGDPRAW